MKPPCNLPGIGVFGCNKLSEFLVNCLIKNDFRITAVWSDQLEQAQAFAQRFKINFYTDKIDNLLLKKEVELILINCDQALYVQIVTKAFRIGKHVFCNWPSSLTIRELNEMYDAASYYPSLISIYSFPLRFLPQFKLMRSLILEQNYIGEINFINVNVNGRSLIELDTVEQLFNQSNCMHCRKIVIETEALKEIQQQQLNSVQESDQIEEQFVDPNNVELLNVKNKQKSKIHDYPKVCKLKTHLNTTTNHSNNSSNLPENSKNNQTLAKKRAGIAVNNLLIRLKTKLKVNNSANQKYNELMQSNGLLQSIGSHVIDIISFITNLKAKKCNGILRTFNQSPFSNELSLIKRITVDDFCTFQMQMDKVPETTYVTVNKQSAKANHDRKSDYGDKNRPNEQVNGKGPPVEFNYKKQVKHLSNSEPIAIVCLNDHLDTLDKGYEIIVAGEFGYLRLKDGDLFGRQYEQNNNDGLGNLDSLDEEKKLYLMKDHFKLSNCCVLHQSQKLSKIIIQKNQLIKPFELGLEKLVESIKNAFDNEMSSTGCKINNLSNVAESDKKKLLIDGDKNQINYGPKAYKQLNHTEVTNVQFKLAKENEVKQQANNQSNENNATIVQINDERNLGSLPLKEKQTDLSKIKSTKLNGTTTIPVDQQNSASTGNRKIQQNGITTKTDEKIVNGKQRIKDLSSEVSEKDSVTGSTMKTQQSSNSIDDSSLSSIDSTETAVIGSNETNKLSIDSSNLQSKMSSGYGEICCNRWFKEAVLLASNFEDGKYVLSVIEAIRSSSRLCEWTKVQNYLPKKQ